MVEAQICTAHFGIRAQMGRDALDKLIETWSEGVDVDYPVAFYCKDEKEGVEYVTYVRLKDVVSISHDIE